MVEFVSYTGAYPNLCSGILTLRINGKLREMPKYCMHSGGEVTFDDKWLEHVTSGPWTIDVPDDLLPLKEEIEKVVNDTIPWGCCGGCV